MSLGFTARLGFEVGGIRGGEGGVVEVEYAGLAFQLSLLRVAQRVGAGLALVLLDSKKSGKSDFLMKQDVDKFSACPRSFTKVRLH